MKKFVFVFQAWLLFILTFFSCAADIALVFIMGWHVVLITCFGSTILLGINTYCLFKKNSYAHWVTAVLLIPCLIGLVCIYGLLQKDNGST
jgi:hypothetical protein